ncbi:hypothetical protein DC20_03835 [Rufibacter tibetensis]|uniref:Uncharacterized protein n=1 Tax=Rufibacter tibetensis TaxID=512763 RepID=A0A0P0CPJ5_9BACT|nr:hypothetical protein DC20_03835 [Rufibacter tibetensis]
MVLNIGVGCLCTPFKFNNLITNGRFLILYKIAVPLNGLPFAWVYELCCFIFSGKRSRPRGPAFRPRAVASRLPLRAAANAAPGRVLGAQTKGWKRGKPWTLLSKRKHGS